jgi:hypothetical protein
MRFARDPSRTVAKGSELAIVFFSLDHLLAICKIFFFSTTGELYLLVESNMHQDPSSQEYADEVARLRASESDSDAELLVCLNKYSFLLLYMLL